MEREREAWCSGMSERRLGARLTGKLTLLAASHARGGRTGRRGRAAVRAPGALGGRPARPRGRLLRTADDPVLAPRGPGRLRRRVRGVVRAAAGGRAAARQGLRRVHRRGASPGAPRDAPARRGRPDQARAGASGGRRRRGATPPAATARPARLDARRRRPVRASLARARRAAQAGRGWSATSSGSMEPYARMLLAYMQACVAARRRVEAFVFGTRLTRVTAELRGRDPGAALELRRAVPPIGEALATLNREHGRRVGSGAVVVLLSDGWDRGDPGQLEREVARLARCSHRLIWLNPLKAHRTARRRCPTWTSSWPPTRSPRWRSSPPGSTRWARDRRDRAGARVRASTRPSSSPTSTAARCSSTRSGR